MRVLLAICLLGSVLSAGVPCPCTESSVPTGSPTSSAPTLAPTSSAPTTPAPTTPAPTTPAPVAPTPSPTICFSMDTKLTRYATPTTEVGESVAIRDLRLGDSIKCLRPSNDRPNSLSSAVGRCTIYRQGHVNEDKLSDFVQLTHSGPAPATLTLTPHHYLWNSPPLSGLADGALVPSNFPLSDLFIVRSDEVKVGSYVVVNEPSLSNPDELVFRRIVAVAEKQLIGAANIIASNGGLFLADGLLVSGQTNKGHSLRHWPATLLQGPWANQAVPRDVLGAKIGSPTSWDYSSNISAFYGKWRDSHSPQELDQNCFVKQVSDAYDSENGFSPRDDMAAFEPLWRHCIHQGNVFSSTNTRRLLADSNSKCNCTCEATNETCTNEDGQSAAVGVPPATCQSGNGCSVTVEPVEVQGNPVVTATDGTKVTIQFAVDVTRFTEVNFGGAVISGAMPGDTYVVVDVCGLVPPEGEEVHLYRVDGADYVDVEDDCSDVVNALGQGVSLGDDCYEFRVCHTSQFVAGFATASDGTDSKPKKAAKPSKAAKPGKKSKSPTKVGKKSAPKATKDAKKGKGKKLGLGLGVGLGGGLLAAAGVAVIARRRRANSKQEAAPTVAVAPAMVPVSV